MVDAHVMCTGVLAFRPGFASALMGEALSHIVVDGSDRTGRFLKGEMLAAVPGDEDTQMLLGLCYTLARRQGETRAMLAPLATGEGPRAEPVAGLPEKLRQEP